MLILLASANGSLSNRWQGLVAEGNQVRECRTLSELKQQASSGEVELVLLHRELVDVAACADLRAAAPKARLFLLSDRPDPEEGLAFLKVGIVGYANSYIARDNLQEALRVVAGGGVWLGQQVIQQLILEAAQNSAAAGKERNTEKLLAPLTPTERRVAEMVAAGRTNLEIAADMGIVERTVKAHLTSIYGKLPAGNRLSLALLVNQG
ncbi:LuxR C-terminal-related transcriptional regulator [Geomonas paludis]|uniref:Helix-turn-helix transcriptional regulator n=1 Tax=Geomonas paludis TaxID=2740185 RepID=A0A6V8N317_9BACT|nr:LuxR C-terminal-related transcriptional regulator [Geomonas paludis]UPU37212.1 LuxR C-terminal-related transcriptional regulator [Geomonas paludis]GFO66354.1 helix-turn-helix transcriptional regulator [Geomonas paludis]